MISLFNLKKKSNDSSLDLNNSCLDKVVLSNNLRFW